MKATDSPITCRSYAPKTSDLIETGDAASSFVTQGLTIFSQVTVLQNATMVNEDTTRTFTSKFLPCFRTDLQRKLGVLSLRQIPFPRVAPITYVVRALYHQHASGKSYPTVLDELALGSGRVEVTIEVVAILPPGNDAPDETQVTALDERLAAIVTGRIFRSPVA